MNPVAIAMDIRSRDTGILEPIQDSSGGLFGWLEKRLYLIFSKMLTVSGIIWCRD
jgi:hypothetical protein